MNLNDYQEVTRAVEFRTMDAAIHVNVDEDSLGEIQIIPVSQGHLAPVQDEIIFNPLNGNDCQILQFLAEHAARWHAKALAEEAAAGRNPSEVLHLGRDDEQKKPAAVLNGNGVTPQLREWALK